MVSTLDLLVACASVCVWTPAGEQGAVVVLDDTPGPGVDATDFESAMALAADGDTILVRAGTHSLASEQTAIAVHGRELAVVAEAGAAPVLLFGIQLSGVPEGSVFHLRGLELNQPNGYALDVLGGAGTVWVEDCDLRGTSPYSGHLRMLDAADVVVVRSRLDTEPHSAGDGSLASGAGIMVLGGALYLYDSVVRGRPGHAGEAGIQAGSAAVFLGDGFLFASGNTLSGGDGAPGFPIVPFGCTGPTDGAAALELGDAAPLALTVGNVLAGGAPGELGCSGVPAETGPLATVASGTITPLGGAARSFEADSPIASGGLVTLSFTGSPAELVGVLAAVEHGALPLPVYGGALFVDSTALLVTTTSLGPSGTTALALVDSLITPTNGFVRIVLQAFFVDIDLTVTLGPASLLTTLDPSF